MELHLTKPLVIFDLETTGLDLVNDRIIQISYIKAMPDGTEKRGNLLVNPEKEIPQVVVELTGIDNEKVKDEPTFKQLAPKLAEEFKGCDFAGFNSNRFDIPMLCEEFLRAQVDFDFSKCRLIDAQTIFHKMERRNLAAAYKFYTGHKMEDDFEAHRADQDAEATYAVLKGELDKYAPGVQEEEDRVLNNDMDELAEFFDLNENILEEDDVETIAGLVVKLLGRIAVPNDQVSFSGLTFTVKEVDGARITLLEIFKEPVPASEQASAE